jgi:hypothetical protein
MAIISLISIIGGWVLRTLWDATTKLRKDLDDLRVHIAQTYVPQERLDKSMDKMMEILHRIEDAIAKKVDKP